MVLLDTKILAYPYDESRGPAENGLKITTADNLLLDTIIFNLCKACENKSMASIPPSAFSAGRIRDTQRQKSKNAKDAAPNKYFNTAFMEPSPMKYNSKLMNSIWGLYNRYSPHNVKKVCDANVELHQSPNNSTNKNEPMINLPSPKLDNVWASINVSQSH